MADGADNTPPLNLGRIIEANIAADLTQGARADGRYLHWLDRATTAQTLSAMQQSPETLGALNSFSHAPNPNPWAPSTRAA